MQIDRERELPNVVAAARDSAHFARTLNRRQCQRKEDRNYRDAYYQLHECHTATGNATARHSWGTVCCNVRPHDRLFRCQSAYEDQSHAMQHDPPVDHTPVGVLHSQAPR